MFNKLMQIETCCGDDLIYMGTYVSDCVSGEFAALSEHYLTNHSACKLSIIYQIGDAFFVERCIFRIKAGYSFCSGMLGLNHCSQIFPHKNIGKNLESRSILTLFP